MYCFFLFIGQITLLDHLHLAANVSFFYIYQIAGHLYSNDGTYYLLYSHITQQCHRQLPLIFLPPSKVTDIDPFNFHSTQLQSIVFPIFTPQSKITDNLLFDHPAMTQTTRQIRTPVLRIPPAVTSQAKMKNWLHECQKWVSHMIGQYAHI